MASELAGEKREGSASVKKSGANKLSYVSTWHFLVGTDSPYVQREEVLFSTPGLPVVGLIYGDIGATCISKTATRRPNQVLLWDVTCEFDTAAEDQKQDPENPSEDPTTWIPIFEIDGVETKDVVLLTDFSTSPKKCLNSANVAFSEPLIKKLSICSIPFYQFEPPELSVNTIIARNERTNTTAFRVFPARTLKLSVTGAVLGSFAGIAAWKISYRAIYDPETWDEVRDDVGPTYKSGTDLVAFKDLTNSFRIVGKLNGSGGKQADQSAVPTTIKFRPYEPIEFNDFLRS